MINKKALIFAFVINFMMLSNSYAMNILDRNKMSESYDDSIVDYSRNESISLDSPFESIITNTSLSDDEISKLELDDEDPDSSEDNFVFKLDEEIEQEREKKRKKKVLIENFKRSFIPSRKFNSQLDKKANFNEESRLGKLGLTNSSKFSGYEVKTSPLSGGILDLILSIKSRIKSGEKIVIDIDSDILSEEVSNLLLYNGVRSRYVSNGTSRICKLKLIEELRSGEIDVLVGVSIFKDDMYVNNFTKIFISDLS